MSKLKSNLEEKLVIAFKDSAVGSWPVTYKLSHDDSNEEDAISGTLTFFSTKNGEEALVEIMNCKYSELCNETRIDDFLADALSKLLNQHTKWQRL